MPQKKGSKKTSRGAEAKKDPRFAANERNFRVGGDIRPSGTDLSRYVKWPVYVRIQRQRKILQQRLRVPPAINQFRRTLDKNQAAELFKLLDKYKPETKAEKKERLTERAKAAEAGGKDVAAKARPTLQFGLKHVTNLVEKKKCKLVAIAHDVDPIELVVWLPALCRKMEVPYCIVKGKSRLGALVHQKNATVVALTAVDGSEKKDLKDLETLSSNFFENFNSDVKGAMKRGDPVLGLKSQAKIAKRKAAIDAELKKKALL